jgi:hypothetical protein
MQKPIIEITSDYGFDHNWTLHAFGLEFYLGQDVKFCSRVLGTAPSEIVAHLGSNDFTHDSSRRKLAKYIMDRLGIDCINIKSIKPWALCAQ